MLAPPPDFLSQQFYVGLRNCIYKKLPNEVDASVGTPLRTTNVLLFSHSSLKQCVPNYNMHTNHIAILLTCRFCISNEFLAIARAAGPWTDHALRKFENMFSHKVNNKS